MSEPPDDTWLPALRSLNRARASDPGDPDRSAALLEGLQRLLAVHPLPHRRPRREGSGAHAYRELRSLLSPGTSAGGPLGSYLDPLLERLCDILLDHPSRRLAAYGSLRPGEANHHVVADVPGRWTEGTTRGTLHSSGWGAGLGYPGLEWDPRGREVTVAILESTALPAHWERLDAFEGEAYRRILVSVETAEGRVVCNLYAIRGPSGSEIEEGGEGR